MKRRSFAFLLIFIAGAFGFGSLVDAQTRQFKVCVPDYSVGVMPFVAKQNGYFAQEQIDIEVIAGEGQSLHHGTDCGFFSINLLAQHF